MINPTWVDRPCSRNTEKETKMHGLCCSNSKAVWVRKVRAKEEEEAKRLVEDAKLLEEAGCFAIVLEKIPAELAAEVAKSVNIPIIGIGAGGAVDGQVLVVHDMLGVNNDFNPRFLRKYHNLYEEMLGSFHRYIEDVKSGDFPNENEQY